MHPLWWLKSFSHHRKGQPKNFNCCKLGDQSPFLITIYNGGSPGVNKYFPTFVLMDVMDV
jgi:hypothetical protein